jgi:hypothetical protein
MIHDIIVVIGQYEKITYFVMVRLGAFGTNRPYMGRVFPLSGGISVLNATRFKRMKRARCISVYVSGGIG